MGKAENAGACVLSNGIVNLTFPSSNILREVRHPGYSVEVPYFEMLLKKKQDKTKPKPKSIPRAKRRTPVGCCLVAAASALPTLAQSWYSVKTLWVARENPGCPVQTSE
jgi:hypothetical protein